MLVRVFTLFSLPVLLSASVWAAEPAPARLEAVAGKVLVNQGKGFSAATKDMALRPGTKIMLGQDGAAVLAFPATATAPGCKVPLAPLSMTRVTGPNVCSRPLAESGGVFDQPVITPTASEEAPGGIPPAAIGVGFFAVTFGAGVVTLFEDNNKTPISAP
jgi:hypothetical protein